MPDPILVADIGGTNARFALAERIGGVIGLRDARSLRAEDFETVDAAAESFLNSINARPARACFAAAGPVINHEVDFTNSHWTLRQGDIAQALSLRDMLIVNDFHALAAGVAHLDQDAFRLVRDAPGDENAPQLVIGPGTGLGQALVVHGDGAPKIIATEGGHVAYAPQTSEESEIAAHIARRFSRVSAERLLSGPGLQNTYEALCAVAGEPCDAAPAEDITAAALAGTDPVAVRTVNLFCEMLGSAAGDAVLATGARGGVILGGGVLPKIEPLFMASGFSGRFADKGRMGAYLEPVPVRMIVQEGAALYGAAAMMLP